MGGAAPLRGRRGVVKGSTWLYSGRPPPPPQGVWVKRCSLDGIVKCTQARCPGALARRRVGAPRNSTGASVSVSTLETRPGDVETRQPTKTPLVHTEVRRGHVLLGGETPPKRHLSAVGNGGPLQTRGRGESRARNSTDLVRLKRDRRRSRKITLPRRFVRSNIADARRKGINPHQEFRLRVIIRSYISNASWQS